MIEEPQINDYVICYIDPEYFTGLRKELEYINNTIGQLYKTRDENVYNSFHYYIKYWMEIPEDIKYWFGYIKQEKCYYRSVKREDILHFSSSLEELQIIKTTEKYNL